jgi:hypothetical protein
MVSSVVHPWYVLWLLPFLTLYPLWSGIVWTYVVGFTYVVLIRYTREHVWQLHWSVPIIEYAVVFSLLTKELLRGFKQNGIGTVTAFGTDFAPANARALNVAVIIPALNEEKAIARVLKDLPPHLVSDRIVVDNGSTDRTASVAREAGARVFVEPKRGYG